MRALIVDDEALARDALRILLEEHMPDVHVAGEAASAAEGLLLCRKHKPDLLFLDVQMPGGDGFSLLRELGSWDFDVIFITGSDKHAIRAIRFSALDYLMKPVHPEELKVAVARHGERSGMRGKEAQENLLRNASSPHATGMKLTLTHGDRSYAVTPAEIAWCQAADNYTAFHLADERRFLSAYTLKDYDAMLAPLGFVRVHKSALVNRLHVQGVDNEGYVRLRDGTRVAISRRRWSEVSRLLQG